LKEKYCSFFSKTYNNLKSKNNISFKYYIVILFIIYFIFTFNIQNWDISYQNEVYVLGKDRFYLNKEMIDKYNKYIKICSLGILTDKKKYPLRGNPKISITIPIYNGGKYLYYSLRSIQNQKMKDIEIIFIDDNSSDDSISIIEKFMEEDPRIKLIKNKENRKILYSKSIAALNAKGKYIFQFDQDDILIRNDVLNYIYNEAVENKLDLVHIRDIYKNEFYFNKRTKVNFKFRHMLPYKETHYKKQPELKNKLFIENNNYILWGLLIKTNLYKRAIYKLWPIVINYKLVFFEDHTITFMVVILAEQYKYLNNFGIIHLAHKKAISNKFLDNEEFYLSLLFFLNNLYDFYVKEHPKDIYIITNFFISMKNYIKKAKKLFPNLFYFIIKKIFNDNILSYEEIKQLLTGFNGKNDKYKNWNTYENIMNSSEYYSIYSFQNSKITTNINNLIVEPQISIIISLSNNEITMLKNTIKSIENQNFKKFEIILICDFNEKMNINNIKEYIKAFPNIKIIKNNEQKGFLYSYSMGILYSKGEYILIMESGNTLAKENVLNELYNNLKNNDIDILEFNLLINKNETISNESLRIYRCSHFKSEINLSKIKYNLNFKELDEERELLINKIIKKDIYKNVINNYISSHKKTKIYYYLY
jgi:glycosyltransferase involved in cell wall biosynthesis